MRHSINYYISTLMLCFNCWIWTSSTSYALLGLTLNNKTEKDAMLYFRPFDLNPTAGQEKTRNSTLKHFEITLNENLEIIKIYDLKINTNKIELQNVSSNGLVGIRLSRLTPFTNYTVKVREITGVDNKKTSSIVFTTGKHVPERPALLHPFSFSVIRPEGNLSHPVISISWKPIPQAAHGGNHLNYVIEVSSGKWYYKLNTSKSYAFVEDGRYSNAMKVKIWAANEIGTSQNYSEMLINIKEQRDISAVAEFSEGGDVNIYVNSCSFYGAEKIAIQVCEKGTHSNQNICLEILVTDVIDLDKVTDKGTSIYKFTFPVLSQLSKKDAHDVEMQYFYLNNLNDTLNISRSELVSINSSFTDNSKFETLQSLKYEEMKNKKIFISAMVDGDWTSMVPINCNFGDFKRHGSSNVKLNITKLHVSAEDNNHRLSFMQNCEPSPNQFMAKYFVVFSSSSPNCDKDRQQIANLSNTIFDEVHCILPTHTEFVCIEVVGQNNESDVLGPFIIFLTGKYQTSEDKKSAANIIAILLPILVVLLVVASGSVALYQCRKGQHRIKELNKTDIAAEIENMVPNQSVELTTFSYTVSNQSLELTTFLNTESDEEDINIDSGIGVNSSGLSSRWSEHLSNYGSSLLTPLDSRNEANVNGNNSCQQLCEFDNDQMLNIINDSKESIPSSPEILSSPEKNKSFRSSNLLNSFCPCSKSLKSIHCDDNVNVINGSESSSVNDVNTVVFN